MTNDEIQELERHLESATPGPWRYLGPIRDVHDCGIVTDESSNLADDVGVEDGILIAALRNAAPALIQAAKERDELRAQLAAAREALEVADRVLHFDLRKMLVFGADYNQAVKDAADAARAALRAVDPLGERSEP